MKTLLLLALITIGCLPAAVVAAPAKTDAEIRKQLLGLWRSPRHEFEFRSNGIIYMLPADSDSTTSQWAVKKGLFYWDNDACAIVTLTDKRFVYRSLATKGSPVDFVLIRITKSMVGKGYNPESVR